MNEIALAYYAQHTMTHGTAMQIAATEAVAEIERLRAALAAGCSGFHDDGSAPPRIQGLLNALRPNVPHERLV